jgi:hypothetical protein
VPSKHGATLDECPCCLRGVFDAPTVEALVRSIDAGRSAATPANDLDSILHALLGLSDESMRWVSGVWDDRSWG